MVEAVALLPTTMMSAALGLPCGTCKHVLEHASMPRGRSYPAPCLCCGLRAALQRTWQVQPCRMPMQPSHPSLMPEMHPHMHPSCLRCAILLSKKECSCSPALCM